MTIPVQFNASESFIPVFSTRPDPETFGAGLMLSDALLTITREHEFPVGQDSNLISRNPPARINWTCPTTSALKTKQHPKLARQHVTFDGGNHFRNPTLLECIAENPVRHNSLPANILNVTKVVLYAGVEEAALNETLILVSSGRVARECQVQTSLIDLQCARGADPDAALQTTVVLGELAAANALIECGARMNLPIAAGLGRMADLIRLLPSSINEDRHLALSLVADLGQFEIVKLLLEAGVGPNRYNPFGGYSHTTPLHQAAGRGYENIVRLLVEHGARLDTKDLVWNATPADWARHSGMKEIEAYLLAHEARKE